MNADGLAYGATKTPVAPQAAKIEGVADDRLEDAVAAGPFTGIQAELDADLLKRLHGIADEALGAAIRGIALTDDGQLQGGGGFAACPVTIGSAMLVRCLPVRADTYFND